MEEGTEKNVQVRRQGEGCVVPSSKHTQVLQPIATVPMGTEPRKVCLAPQLVMNGQGAHGPYHLC